VRAAPRQGWAFSAVTYADDRFVAVGQQGIVVTSPDGITWSQTAQLPVGELDGLAYGNGLWVAGGWDGAIFTSTDTVMWTRRSSEVNTAIRAITFGNGRFVAVGIGLPLTSDDGIAWTVQRVNPDLEDVLWDGARFVGAGPFTTIAASPDGVSFEQLPVESRLSRSRPINGLEHMLGGIARSPERYVAVGGVDVGGSIVVSEDGMSWRRHLWVTRSVRRVRYLDGQFIAIGGGWVLTSPDGLTWTAYRAPAGADLIDVAWGGGRLVAVGQGGTVLSRE
jgi:hypothetical protein